MCHFLQKVSSRHFLFTTFSARMEGSQIVQLNIGGVKFSTTQSTLSKSDYFTFILSDSRHLVKDNEGSIFIDRNGSYFEPILHYLRTGVWKIPKVRCVDLNIEIVGNGRRIYSTRSCVLSYRST